MTALDEARAALKRHRQELLGQLAQLDAALLALGGAPTAPAEEVAPEPRPRRVKSAPAKRAAKVAPAPAAPTTGFHRARMLELVRASGPVGLLRTDVATRLGLPIANVRAMSQALVVKGLLRVVGERGEQHLVAADVPEVPPAPAPLPRPAPSPKVAPRAPAVGELRRVVKVEFITSREDRFDCVPLACKLTAGACVDRQKAANSDETGSWSQGNGAKKSEGFRACKSCPLGRQVAARVEAA